MNLKKPVSPKLLVFCLLSGCIWYFPIVAQNTSQSAQSSGNAPQTATPPPGDNIKRVVIHVGAPSVWSLGQAHYLITKLHRQNRGLETAMPDKIALDPNRVNSTRITILKTLLDIQAQFDQKLSIENKAKLNEYERKLNEREEARAQLRANEAEIKTLDEDIASQKKKLVALQTEFKQKQSSVSGRTMAAPTQEELRALELEIAIVEKDIQLKEAQKTNLAQKNAALTTKASASIEGPAGLANVGFSDSNASQPSFDNLVSGYLTNAANTTKEPRLAATIALDNYIGMQYEIIAKQLTLLRDEVGPQYRIFFLELPASVYTVAGKGDDYLAQVQWKITKYYIGDENQDEANKDEENEEGEDKEEDKGKDKDKDIERKGEGKKDEEKEGKDKEVKIKCQKKSTYLQKVGIEESNDTADCWRKVTPDRVRALDIIPRQSSLNINDVQATARQMNMLGVLKLISGFGLKVNYQRQKQLYEEFMQQEVFAAGFGKGLPQFGWTIGLLPGTKRIAPGTRTMYAIIVAPRETEAIKLQASGIAYHRKEAPNYTDSELGYTNSKQLVFQPQEFTVALPNENAFEGNWYANEISYIPVSATEQATVVISGKYFSSQTSILVNGVPLTNAHSIGNNVLSDAVPDVTTPGTVRGQFEIVNSRQLILRFSMPDKSYVGTPEITLVSPDKSSSLNFFRMKKINGISSERLRNLSLREPIFIKPLTLTKKLDVIKNREIGGEYVLARLKGDGLRRAADIWIDNRSINNFPKRRSEQCGYTPEAWLANCPDQEFAYQIDTKEYLLYFRPPNKSSWPVRFRQKTITGFEVEEFIDERVPPSKARDVEIVSYLSNPATKSAQLTLRFHIKPEEAELNRLCIDSRLLCNEMKLRSFYEEGDGKWRGVFNVYYEDHGTYFAEREKVSVTVKSRNADGSLVIWTKDNLEIPLRPQITQVAITLSPIEGDASTQITIEGLNLQNVAQVFVAGKEAAIVGIPSNTSIVVKLSNVFIKEKNGIKVPIVLVTKTKVSVSGMVTLKQ